MAITSTLTCDDGTEIPFDWVYADADKEEWVRDRSHWPQPMTPMSIWILAHSWPGADRAWSEAAIDPPAMFHRFQLVGPYFYVRQTPNPPEDIATMIPQYRELVRQHGSALQFWENYARPRIQRACSDLAAAPADASVVALAETWAYGFHQTFTSLTPLFESSMRITALLTEAMGDDATLATLELTQGGENATQQIDREIWELAELARQSPAVLRILASGAGKGNVSSLHADPSTATFVAAFDALVERHGSRSQGWELELPTWCEQPEAPLSLIRAQLDGQPVSAEELAARSAAARHGATERALAALPKGQHAELKELIGNLDGYVSIREGRAYWQMIITGEMRGALLRKGADLVQNGRIDRADDIFFLTPNDFENNETSDLRSVVAERRSEQERFLRLAPPPVIGTPVTPPPPAGAAPDELRGMPASRGEITATARVLQSAGDVARLKHGDILVCLMTTPAWTPLFAVAGGIVTETGAALSHPAITAREYGIPAVVAVPEATRLIRDGQKITIDGGKGIVTLHE